MNCASGSQIGIGRVARFKGQRVNEDRFTAAEENVMRGGILQPETLGQCGPAKVEGQFAGGPEHFRRPFVRITAKGKPLVFETRPRGTVASQIGPQLGIFTQLRSLGVIQTARTGQLLLRERTPRAVGLEKLFESSQGIGRNPSQHTLIEDEATARGIAERWCGAAPLRHLGF